MELTPQLKAPDSTASLLLRGYPYVSQHCRRLHSDAFRARLLGERVLCLSSREAAQLFYDENYFVRANAVPKLIQDTLFGRGGVQGLDDEAHRHRKALFMRFMGPNHINEFIETLLHHFRDGIERWRTRDHVVLFDEVATVLCRAACDWCGVELPEDEMQALTLDCLRRVDGFATLGPRMWQARRARRRSEQRLVPLIHQARQAPAVGTPPRPVTAIAHHEDADGALLDAQVAAVELLNLIRPIVAISTYVSFAALALHDYPDYRDWLTQNPEHAQWFAKEVRRYYPFTPLLGARARRSFRWNGISIEQGELVLLDIYGLQHDRRYWNEPQRFWPERFREPQDERFVLIPQGGGDFLHGHRCAGEWLTQRTLAALAHELSTADYLLPPQDLSFPLSRIPTRPRSGVVASFASPARSARSKPREALTEPLAPQV